MRLDRMNSQIGVWRADQINKRVIIGQFNNAYNTNNNYDFDIIINREEEVYLDFVWFSKKQTVGR